MIYLDNSATTRTLREAADVAHQYMLEDYFNAAAAYSPAVANERAVNTARNSVASAIGATQEEIIFTSGGTESNNMAILGSLGAMHGRGRIIASAVEHPSVSEVFRSLEKEYEVRYASVTPTGEVDLHALEALITADTMLVSVMQVNNEVGAIHDIEAIYRMLKKRAPGALLHVDGVQGYLKVPLRAGWCDLYSISGHKFHAPKGVGALYVKRGTKFLGGLIGGGQEKNLRSGTTNTPGIMGMKAAVDYYLENATDFRQNMRQCKMRLAKNFISIPDVFLNGPEADAGAPHILNAAFMGVRGEVLLHALEEREIYVSTGSACSAHKKGKNRILNAMGIVGGRQDGAIRFSLCPFNTAQEMDETANAIADILPALRKFKRR